MPQPPANDKGLEFAVSAAKQTPKLNAQALSPLLRLKPSRRPPAHDKGQEFAVSGA
jgi:hypothetical protein